jgi:hypothetical protein
MCWTLTCDFKFMPLVLCAEQMRPTIVLVLLLSLHWARSMPTICSNVEPIVTQLSAGVGEGSVAPPAPPTPSAKPPSSGTAHILQKAAERSVGITEQDQAAEVRTPQSGAGPNPWLPVEAIQEHVSAQKVSPSHRMLATLTEWGV